MKRLSVVVITKNEEVLIGECLRSVSFADELVVVDDYSKDRTVEIAKRKGARVFRRKFDTLGKQKQYAIERAQGEWILQLDADERVSPALRKEIEQVLSKPTFDAYNIYFHQYFLGEPLVPTLSGGHPRLFRRGVGRFSDAPVHEGPFVSVPKGQLRMPITHYSHRSISQLIAKFNQYTDWEARVLYEGGLRSNWMRILLAPLYTFLRRQWVEKDFLSGIRGLVLSVLFSLYSLMKWLKVWEIGYHAESRGRRASIQVKNSKLKIPAIAPPRRGYGGQAKLQLKVTNLGRTFHFELF